MPEYKLEIRFLSDWHIGSGLGDGAVADAILNRDVNGIPWLPGSALKGALREGAWRLALCKAAPQRSFVDFLFGTNSQERTSNSPGHLDFGDGSLPADLVAALLAARPDDRRLLVGDMTILRQQTRLDDQKRVVPHSLRSIECGIPGLLFTASLEARLPDAAADWLTSYLNAICACVKSMGGDRSRGLGRCQISLVGAGSITLPGPIPACLENMLNKEAAA